HMQTASITRAELEGARALAKARSCAVIDEWNCVEHNASRALAIDPKNSESRALLGQAIRTRLCAGSASPGPRSPAARPAPP
ncbi:hypothetical protein NO135_23125, partial [Clostridioides difficile]|nr:hypothetical protein [Clostridioides difficile]